MTKASKLALAVLILLLMATIPSAYAQENGAENGIEVEPTPLSPDLVAGVVFIFWFVGIVVKAMMPFYRKLKLGDIENFDVRYLWVFIINVVALLGQAVKTFGQEYPLLPPIYDSSMLMLVGGVAFVVGAGLTWAVDELVKWMQFIKPEQK